MGLQDRDYMRRPHAPPRQHVPPRRGTNWRTWLGSLVVNINDSTPEQLETVPGIGPSLAALIIAGRPYQRVDDLLRISGIGERTLQSMRPFVKTDGETRPH